MKNKYLIKGKVTEIFIKQRNGNVIKTVIDTEDLQRLKENGYSVCVRWDEKRKTYRAKTKVVINGKAKLVYLYRFLINAPNDMLVDHKDHDTLNNLKENLRMVNNSQNLQNRAGADVDNVSGNRNVWWNKQQNKWSVSFRNNGKHFYCGSYNSLRDAIKIAETKRNEFLPYAISG